MIPQLGQKIKAEGALFIVSIRITITIEEAHFIQLI